jgi:hypothetical protein
VDAVGAVPGHRNRPDATGPAGVGEQGKSTMGVPQERRRSCRFHRKLPGGRYRVTNSRRPPAAALGCGAGERRALGWYRWRQGNEARREERQEVIAP